MGLIFVGIGGLIVLSGVMAVVASANGTDAATLKKRTGVATPGAARVLGFVQLAVGAGMILFAFFVLPKL